MRYLELFPNLPMVFAALMVAILFIQSGLDKVFDFKGQLDWLNGHFSKSILAGTVAPMLVVLTVMELATGLMAAVGLGYFLIFGIATIVWWASVVGALTFVALFFGQRVAKDYPGAASLIPYFLLDLALMYLSHGK